jgi:hypothetical protein
MSETANGGRGPSEAGLTKSEWQGHRVAANVLRALVFLMPISAAGATGLFVSRSISGDSARMVAVRIISAAIASVLMFLAVERLARRFLPLAFLLRLNLVFPDRAPSRFSVALRSTSVRKLQQWVREARESEDAAVLAEKVVTLASALNTHDRRTRGHCERTRALADLISEELHLSPREANEVRWGAFLHDIGKLVVPAEILNKPGKPTSREWEVLRSHPEAGARLVEPLRSFLSSGVDAVGGHHENYDGTGYPAGLAGEQLALAARIVSVADSFEVMTAVRAYKRPMTTQGARAELARRSGTQFDPMVVRAFLNVSLGRLHWALGIAAWIAELPFLTILPRVAAQISTSVGGGAAISPSLPGIAAASLGAMAVIGHVDTPKAAPVAPGQAVAASAVLPSAHEPQLPVANTPTVDPPGTIAAPTPSPIAIAPTQDLGQTQASAQVDLPGLNATVGINSNLGLEIRPKPLPNLSNVIHVAVAPSASVGQNTLGSIGVTVDGKTEVLDAPGTPEVLNEVVQTVAPVVTTEGVVEGAIADLP